MIWIPQPKICNVFWAYDDGFCFVYCKLLLNNQNAICLDDYKVIDDPTLLKTVRGGEWF